MDQSSLKQFARGNESYTLLDHRNQKPTLNVTRRLEMLRIKCVAWSLPFYVHTKYKKHHNVRRLLSLSCSYSFYLFPLVQSQPTLIIIIIIIIIVIIITIIIAIVITIERNYEMRSNITVKNVFAIISITFILTHIFMFPHKENRRNIASVYPMSFMNSHLNFLFHVGPFTQSLYFFHDFCNESSVCLVLLHMIMIHISSKVLALQISIFTWITSFLNW